MSALSDVDIRQALENGEIEIEPMFPGSLQPASVDFHLGRHFLVFKHGCAAALNLDQPIDNSMSEYEINPGETFTLHVGHLILGITCERVRLSAKYRAQIEGKSSLGRAGLIVHVTAGYIDPGFNAPITLELVNLSGRPVPLHYGMPIAQVAFEELKTPANRVYGSQGLGSKYGGTHKPQASQYYKNFLPPNNRWMEYVRRLEKSLTDD